MIGIAALMLRVQAKSDAARALGDVPDAARARQAAAAAAAAFDAAWAALRPAEEALGALACAPGCAACCHQHVAVLPVEAVAIADRLLADGAATRDLQARVRDVAARVATMDRSSRRAARVACAFLDASEGCAIYAVRPLRCRGVHSRDVGHCTIPRTIRRAEPPGTAAHPPPVVPMPPLQLADAALAGLAEAAAAVGMAVDSLELGLAVDLLLAAPARIHGVLGGHDRLAEAHLADMPSTVAKP
ncbi:MAG: YkgJ family cysteine cluster protein [Alphaproteobacteria bacterium]|nr:YkgJ family cysteine cluster protein [Alphaproteobacteria bacterium]